MQPQQSLKQQQQYLKQQQQQQQQHQPKQPEAQNLNGEDTTSKLAEPTEEVDRLKEQEHCKSTGVVDRTTKQQTQVGGQLDTRFSIPNECILGKQLEKSSRSQRQQEEAGSKGIGSQSSDRLATLIDSGISNNQNSNSKLNREQRIKVTLSAPRSSSDIQSIESPILLDSRLSNTRPIEFGIHEGDSTTKRQSTATLISATSGTNEQGCPKQRELSQSTEPSSAIVAGPWTRLEQEAELRRIASRRTGRASNLADRKKEAEELELCKQSPDLQQQQQQQQQQDPQAKSQQEAPNPKQLAIYINGKIRSNSIFCRSSSSNSFNSLLNRFQLPNQSEPFDKKHCSLKPRHSNPSSRHQRHQQQQQQKRKQSGADAKDQLGQSSSLRLRFARPSGKRLAKSLQNSAHKLITGYLRTGNQASGATDPSRPVSQECKSQQELDQTRELNNEGLLVVRSSDNSSDSSGSQLTTGGTKEEQPEAEENRTSYKLNPSSMFLRKAMRYYRLWIYCTNITILLGTLIFILSTLYVVSDYRIKLLVSSGLSDRSKQNFYLTSETKVSEQPFRKLNGEQERANNSTHNDKDGGADDGDYTRDQDDIYIRYTEPCVILAYAAIAVQAGLLQAIGCFGAVRMKERWIQAFWYLILSLTVFDVVFLMYWLNRYDFVTKSLRRQLTHRLTSHYGRLSLNGSQSSSNELDWSAGQQRSSELLFVYDMDKILTDIIDKIQSDSQCCGITNSLDYKRSLWRRSKVSQLARELNWTTPQEAALLRQVPLVPASCCRRASAPDISAGGKRGRPREPLDDSQRGRPNRVPAWSPAMVVDNRPNPNSVGREANGAKDDELTLAELIDRRWFGQKFKSPPSANSGLERESNADNHDVDDDYGNYNQDEGEGDNYNSTIATPTIDGLAEDMEANLSKHRRRLLAKQNKLKRDDAIYDQLGRDRQRREEDKEEDKSEGQGRQKRDRRRADEDENNPQQWSVASRVDEQQQVLSWLVDLPSSLEMYDHIDKGGRLMVNKISDVTKQDGPQRQLARLRQILFNRRETSENTKDQPMDLFNAEHFKWPNKLQLSFAQYKIIEGYLMELGQTQQASTSNETETEVALERGQASARRARRYSISMDAAHNNHDNTNQEPYGGQQSADSEATNSGDGEQQHRRRLRERLSEALKRDPELSCAPRSYYDQVSLYTHGCQPAIRSWLDSSAHILFVMGFCVLTVLKFCSLVLLRLEIREMIHKIRVLKGMATEYNALHDLEAYLPRPSVCAQAAELTPSGVAAAISSPTNQLPMGNSGCAQPASCGCLPSSVANPAGCSPQQSAPTAYRLGGSFSEAVAAATAAAAAGQQAVGNSGQLGSSGRAASMKAMAAMSAMLATCPRSTSSSSAHLHAGTGSVVTLGQKAALQMMCSADLFQQSNSSMSRRHTAVSVCPAAAAAAAAAAHHLMSRRGTYVANPIFGTPPGAFFCGGSGLNLVQHRHSAHTVNTSSLLNPQQLIGGGSNMKPDRHYFCDTNNQLQQSSVGNSQMRQPHSSLQTTASSTIEHQSSAESGNPPLASNSASNCQRSSVTGSHQLLSLMYPFKRQSSGGAQSAGNFPFDLAPGLLAESRRSIH